MAGIYLQLLAEAGGDGDFLRLPGRSFLIGRGTGCEVRVGAELSSREHAVLELEGNSWIIRDRDSRNGTFLNGGRIQQAALHPLDEIGLGKAEPSLRVITMDPAPPIEDDGGASTRMQKTPGAPTRAEEDGDSMDTVDVEEIPLVPPLPGPRSRTPAPPQARNGPRRMPPIFALLGLLFTAAVAMGVLGADFPYEPAAAPVLWLMAALRYVAPNALPDPGAQLWLFRGLLAVYGLVVGFALQRPIRRMVILVTLAGLHLLAALALG